MVPNEFDNESLVCRANEKLKLANELIEALALGEFKNVSGTQKLQRKIQREMKFLEKTISEKSLKENHIISSNLVHFDFLIKIMRLQQDVINVDCVFSLESRNIPLRVDIVANNGLKWIKAIARNSKSVEDAAMGNGNFGCRNVYDQAYDYLEASNLHTCMFQKPKVVFYFFNKVDESLHQELSEMGVLTASLDDPIVKVVKPQNLMSTELNLDVTTMLGYVSALTNGHSHWIFKEPLLTEQAQKEREEPLKPLLDEIFVGKQLVCCQSAYDAFNNILTTLGGTTEKQRAAEFMQHVTIHPDCTDMPKDLTNMRFTAKVNERSLRVFSFGMNRRIFTTTSNQSFIRAAKMQGINVPVYLHASRALTEKKQETGVLISN